MLPFHCVVRGVAALAVVSVPLVAAAQEPGRSPVPSAVRAAHEFVLAAYPDLRREPLDFHLTPQPDGVWLMSVSRGAPDGGPPEQRGMATPDLLFHGAIAFDATGRLAGYQADGPYLHQAKNAVLRDRLRAHPEFIQSDADVELFRLGGTATVGRAFVPAGGMPAAAALQPYLGDVVSTTAPVFAMRAATPDGTSVVKAVWVLEADATGPGRTPVRYQFVYEPVGGRLIGVTTVGGAR